MASKLAQQQLAALFSAESVVIVGASANPKSFGFHVARALLRDFKGPVHYLNPTEAKVFGFPTLTKLAEVPPGRHLWIIASLTKEFGETLHQIAQRQPLGILLLIELTEAIQKTVQKIISKLPCVVIGPRSAGFYNPINRLDLLPLPPEVLPRPLKGATGVITDNRDVAYGLLEQLAKYRCGVSRLIDLGEAFGTDETDILLFLINDALTKVILLGAGQISNPAKFNKVIKAAHRVKKPIIVSLFPPKIIDQLGLHRRIGEKITALTPELADQHRIMVTPSWGRAVDLALLCQNQPLPQGLNVAAISNFGAYCVYAANAILNSSLRLASLTKSTRTALQDNLPPYCRASNPICVYTNADEVRLDTALRIILLDPNIHSLIISLLPESPYIDSDYLYVMLRQRLQSTKTQKTIVAVIPAVERDNLLIQTMERLNIPVFSNSHRAVTTLENAYNLTQLQTPIK